MIVTYKDKPELVELFKHKQLQTTHFETENNYWSVGFLSKSLDSLYCMRKEFGRFFHKQLASILQDSLSRFKDKK